MAPVGEGQSEYRQAASDGLAGGGNAPVGGTPQSVDAVLDGLGFGQLKRLLPLVRRQYEPLFARRKTVCIVGPVNTGKSSLYNALAGPSAPRAAVSPVPGTTRMALAGDAEAFLVVDTPGANEAAVGAEGAQGGAERHAEAIRSARAADLLVIVFDAAHGIAGDEVRVYAELTHLGNPFVVALNKIDLVRREEAAVVAAAARNLGLAPEDVIPISATRRINLDRLLLAILQADPLLANTLADVLPGCRWLLATNTILGASAGAGTANLMTSPLEIPFASFVPITAIQVAMVLRLARIYGFAMSPARAKELVLTLGSAIAARTLFYQLVDLVPVAGFVLGTAIASGTTMALGYTAAAWFAYGEKPSAEAVKKLTETLTQRLAERLKPSRDRRSLRQGLQQAVAEVLGRVAGEDGTAGASDEEGAP